MRRETIQWIAVIGYASFLMWTAVGTVPPEAAFLWRWHLDKLVHAGEYGVLGLLLAAGLWKPMSGLSKSVVAWSAVCLGVGYGVITESVQATIAWRSAEVLDAVANAAGAALAGLIWLKVMSRVPRHG